MVSYRDKGLWKDVSKGERIRTAVTDLRFMLLDMHNIRGMLAIVLGPNNVTVLDEMLAFITENTPP